MNVPRAAWRAVVESRLAFTSLASVAALVAAGILAVQLVRGSMAEAIDASLAARVPDGSYQLQPLTPRAEQVLAQTPGLAPVSDRVAEVSTAATGEPLAATADVRLTDEPFAPLGVVTAGRAARSAGEVALSRSLAETLAVRLGDDVRVGDAAYKVVGLLVDPADRGAMVASGMVDALGPEEATLWTGPLEAADPAAIELGDEAVVSSASLVRTVAEGNVANPTGPGRYLTLLLLALGCATMALLLASLARSFAPNRDALLHIGMSSRRTSRVGAAVAAVVAGAGALVGVVVTSAVVHVGRDPISGFWGQRWLDVPWAPVTALLLVLGVALVPLGLLAGYARISALATRRRTTAAVVAAVVLGLGLAAFAANVWSTYGFRDAVPILGLLAVNLVVVGGASALPRLRRSVRGRLAQHVGSGLAVVSLVIANVVYLTFFQAGWEWHLHEKYQREPLQVTSQTPGSLVVDDVPDDLVEPLTGVYTELGGAEPLLTQRLRTDAGTVQAVAPSFASCLAADPEIDVDAPPMSCIAGTESLGLIFSVGLTEPTPGGPVLAAAPEIMESGAVGLYTDESPDLPGVNGADSYPATPDPRLGNYMPGVVLTEDHPAASALGLEASGVSRLYFGDYDSLPPADQARFRGALLQYVPSAFPMQNPRTTPSLPGSLYLWSVGGAIVLLLFLAATFAGFVSSTRWVRDLLVQMGARTRARTRIALETFALPLASTFVATGVGWLALEQFAGDTAVPFGWWRFIPAGVALASVLVAVHAFRARPAAATNLDA